MLPKTAKRIVSTGHDLEHLSRCRDTGVKERKGNRRRKRKVERGVGGGGAEGAEGRGGGGWSNQT